MARLQFESRPEVLPQVRRVVRDAAASQGMSSDEVNCMALAVDEACANIIRHAYGPERIGEIILEISATREWLLFRLTDFAETMDVDAIVPRDLDDVRPGGLGVHFIRSVMDQVAYLRPSEGTGNILEMVKTINPSH